MDRKKFIHNGARLSIIIVVAYYLLIGPHSISHYIRCLYSLDKKKQRITQLKSDIDHLNTATTAWNNNPLCTETIARQDLHLGCTNERVYVLKS